MNKILIIGAGKSSSTLIDFLLEKSESHDWKVTVSDLDLDLAKKKIKNHPNGKAIRFDILEEGKREQIIGEQDMVISMIPPSFHIEIAKICAELGINMLTASYLTPEIKALNDKFKQKGVGLIMEMGLDPGIDHMSAMKVWDKIRNAGHKLRAFETFTGGVLSQSNDDNPWEYTFTWNPRNVVIAGQGYAKFIQEGRYKYIPYSKIFKRTKRIHIPELGYFEGYANRDSLKYLDAYKLHGIQTLYRSTLRRVGFCKSWDVFVQLGATDDTYNLENINKMTHRQFINSFLYYNPNDSVELKLAHYMKLDLDSEEMFKLKWLGMFDNELIGLNEGTPAQVLEHILKKKWTIKPDEKDLIVMWHNFEYFEKKVLKKIQSYMSIEGTDSINTAMSKTVGLPLAVSTKLILERKIQPKGVNIPTEKYIYEPVLKELENYGIIFVEKEVKC